MMNTFGFNEWGSVFNSSFQQLWTGFIQFTPRLLVAIVLFIIGWALGNVIASAIEQVFKSLKVDKAVSYTGAENFFRKAGMTLNTGYFIGQVVKWFVIIVFLLPSLNLVGLGEIGTFLGAVALVFLPKVIIAALILIIATFMAEVASKAVTASARTVSVHSANMLGTIAKYSVWIFAFIIALGQLGIAEYYMNTLFAGIITMISLGGALAFGLGGKDAAAKFIAKVSEEVAHKHPEQH